MRYKRRREKDKGAESGFRQRLHCLTWRHRDDTAQTLGTQARPAQVMRAEDQKHSPEWGCGEKPLSVRQPQEAPSLSDTNKEAQHEGENSEKEINNSEL